MKQALWKAFCSFSRKERQGILFLLILTGICVATPALWERCFPPPAELYTHDSALLADVMSLRRALTSGTKVFTGNDSIRSHFRRFAFDPNTIDAAEWKALGLEQKVVDNIQRYLAKGGRFRRKEDLRRIYGLSSGLCDELMPYVNIAARPDTFRHYARYQPYGQNMLPLQSGRKIRYPVLDINTADSAQWESLPGIGPVLAARIVKFRERLGGFYSIRQVGETFGLADSTFNKIQPSLRLHTVSLKKLDLNLMDEKSLALHPYIRHKLARLIVLYRSNHGPFRQPEDLLGIPLVDDSIYRKIEHYIKTENSPL